MSAAATPASSSALGSSGLPSRSLPSRPSTCSSPLSPRNAAGGTVKPRGRPSRPLLSIRTSVSDAVIVIRPRPLAGRIVSTGSTLGSPGCQAQPVRPPSLALHAADGRGDRRHVDRAAQEMAAVGRGDHKSSPSPCGRGLGEGAAPRPACPATSPASAAPSARHRPTVRTSPARRPRGRSHRPARQNQDRAHAAAAPRPAPPRRRRHRQAAGGRSPAPATPPAHRSRR